VMVATATRRTLKSLSNGSRRAQKPFLSFGAQFLNGVFVAS
jgi:hypothetical protein